MADPDSTDAGVVRNTTLALVTQLVTAGLTAFLTLYLTRALEPRRFGEFALAVGVTSVLLVAADFGVSPSVGRFIAEHRDDLPAVSVLLANALALKLIASFVASAGLFLLAAPLATAYGDPHLTWPFRGVAVALLGQSLMMLYSTALVSTGKISANLRLYTSESVAEVVASVALVALGGGATAAAFGRAAGYAVGAGTAGVLAWRAFGARSFDLRSPSRRAVVQIARYAGVLFIVNGAWTLFSQIDILLIGAYVGTAQVGLFSAPLRISTLLHYPGLAVSNSVSPRLARASGREPDVASFRVALRYLVILQAAEVAAVLAWAGPIVHLLGPGYGGSAGVLRALAPFIFLQGLGPLVSVGVNYLGQSRRRVPIAVGAFVLDLIIDVILIPRIGALGGAIATSAAYSMYVPAHILICARLLAMPLRPLLVTTARALAAAAAAAAVLAWVGTSHLTALQWIGGGLGGLAAFVSMLLVTRELTRAELARAYSALAGRLNRRPAR